ncbi:hypothetical protein [Dactylosporangium sp. NPDC005555]|uniref:hypothetical protein n=1 Tax=Dactylosporangium sp. NPDC005555 TaxID=3154889 RepID=UPI0033AD0B7F
MATTEDTTYPALLRRGDELRGRRDGEQRIPALSEVRRLTQESGGQVTVGYQKKLLADCDGEIHALYPMFQRTGREAAQQLAQLAGHIVEARDDLRRRQEDVTAAGAALTDDELRPRNPEEQTWDPPKLRDRREVARSRRIKLAQEAAEAARDRLRQWRAQHADAVRRRDEALAGFVVQARRIAELHHRRIATYLDALARTHPDGRTLYPLLTLPEVPLPAWVRDLDPTDDPSRELEQP